MVPWHQFCRSQLILSPLFIIPVQIVDEEVPRILLEEMEERRILDRIIEIIRAADQNVITNRIMTSPDLNLTMPLSEIPRRGLSVKLQKETYIACRRMMAFLKAPRFHTKVPQNFFIPRNFRPDLLNGRSLLAVQGQ